MCSEGLDAAQFASGLRRAMRDALSARDERSRSSAPWVAVLLTAIESAAAEAAAPADAGADDELAAAFLAAFAPRRMSSPDPEDEAWPVLEMAEFEFGEYRPASSLDSVVILRLGAARPCRRADVARSSEQLSALLALLLGVSVVYTHLPAEDDDDGDDARGGKATPRDVLGDACLSKGWAFVELSSPAEALRTVRLLSALNLSAVGGPPSLGARHFRHYGAADDADGTSADPRGEESASGEEMLSFDDVLTGSPMGPPMGSPFGSRVRSAPHQESPGQRFTADLSPLQPAAESARVGGDGDGGSERAHPERRRRRQILSPAGSSADAPPHARPLTPPSPTLSVSLGAGFDAGFDHAPAQAWAVAASCFRGPQGARLEALEAALEAALETAVVGEAADMNHAAAAAEAALSQAYADMAMDAALDAPGPQCSPLLSVVVGVLGHDPEADGVLDTHALPIATELLRRRPPPADADASVDASSAAGRAAWLVTGERLRCAALLRRLKVTERARGRLASEVLAQRRLAAAGERRAGEAEAARVVALAHATEATKAAAAADAKLKAAINRVRLRARIRSSEDSLRLPRPKCGARLIPLPLPIFSRRSTRSRRRPRPRHSAPRPSEASCSRSGSSGSCRTKAPPHRRSRT